MSIDIHNRRTLFGFSIKTFVVFDWLTEGAWQSNCLVSWKAEIRKPVGEKEEKFASAGQLST